MLLMLCEQEENARAALLLEQAAYALLYPRQPSLRKFAFQMVLAGLRYHSCGQKRLAMQAYRQDGDETHARQGGSQHASVEQASAVVACSHYAAFPTLERVRCCMASCCWWVLRSFCLQLHSLSHVLRRQVLGVYEGKGWNSILEHLHDILGKHCREAGDNEAALTHFMALLRCGTRPVATQQHYLEQFSEAAKRVQTMQVRDGGAVECIGAVVASGTKKCRD